MPFGDYASFDACVEANRDKEDPEAYCGALQAKLEGKGRPAWITRAEMAKLCPPCAAQMAARNLTKVNLAALGALSGDLQQALAKATDPGFMTRCLDDPEMCAGADSKEGCCAALHEKLFGIWPGEHKGAPKGAIRKVLEALLPFLHDDDVGLEPIADGWEALRRTAGADRVVLRKSVPIVKVDAEERLVYGIVYEPGVPDAHGDVMTAGEIRKAAHGFMIRYATLEGDTGVDHVAKVARHELPIVESFIAPVDFTLGAQAVSAGTWLMAGKVLDARLWKDVKAGRYTGWSFEGFGRP